MRRFLIGLFTTTLLLGMSCTAFAQSSSASGSTKQDKKIAKAEKKEMKASEKGKAMHLTGWVKEEGDKTVFVNDKDKQSWTVSNPDVLKPHDGKHVKVTAKLDKADNSMTVDSVKDMRAGKQAKSTQSASQ